MDVVEAIDAWIDTRIDDLSDDELERILQILDDLSLSSFANLDTSDLVDADLDIMVTVVGGDRQQIAYTEYVLRAALFDDDHPLVSEVDADGPDDETDVDAASSDADRDQKDELDGEAASDASNFDELGDDELDHDAVDSDSGDNSELSDKTNDSDELDHDELDHEATVSDNGELSDDTDDHDELDHDVVGDTEALSTPDQTDTVQIDNNSELDGDVELSDDHHIDELAELDDHGINDINDINTDLDTLTNQHLDTDALAELEPDDTDALAELDDHDIDTDIDTDLDTPTNEHLDTDALAELEHDDTDALAELEHDDTDALAELDDHDINDIDTDIDTLTTEQIDTIDPDATQQMPALASTEQLPAVQVVELFPGDSLGPSFLTTAGAAATAEPSRRRWFPVAVVVFLIGGLGLFGFGVARLISSLGDEEVAAEATATAEPEDEAEPTATPPPATATAEPEDETASAAAPEPTPSPTPEPQSSIAIRLQNGDVALVTFEDAAGQPEVETIFDSSIDEFADATNISWMGPRLAIFDANGDFYVYNVNRPNPMPRRLWSAGEGLAPAVDGALVGDELAILTNEGDITFMPGFVVADPEELRLVWDVDEEAVRATDIDVLADLVPFVLEDGNVNMIVTSADDVISTIWSSESQPPVFNIRSTPSGFLMGVGQGSVASWLLLDDGPLLLAAWDPVGFDELPAIAYSSAGARNAVVLADGAVILADDTGNGARVWDPVETELPAVGVDSNSTHVILQLEAGSVVRLPIASPTDISSVWDITDETLNPAAQIALEPLDR